MFQSLFFLDKLVISWLTNSVNAFSSICGVLLVTHVYLSESNKKRGKR